MTPEEIANLVVRLTGDTAQYQSALNQAATTATTTANTVGAATAKIEGFTTGLRSFAAATLGLFAGLGVAGSLGAAFNVFIGAEQAQVRLSAAIESTGQAVDATMEKFKGFADQVTNSTLVTRRQVNAMLEQATVMGFQGDAAERVVKDAIALAKGNGELAQSFIRVGAMIERGHPEFARRILGLQGITDRTQLAAATQQRLASGFKVAEAMAGTTGGQIELLKRSFLGLTVDVGALVAEAIMPLVKWLRSTIDWFKGLDPMVKKVTVAVVAILGAIVSIGPALAFLAPLFGVFGTVIAVLTGPWGLAIAGVVAGLVIVVRQMGGVQAAWDWLKAAAVSAWTTITTKAAEFWAWMQPIWFALESLGTTVWGVIEDAAVQLWEALKVGFAQAEAFILSVWDTITGGARLDWDQIRDSIVNTILFAEWTIKNFGAIAEHVWTGARLSFLVFTEEIQYFFTTVIPAELAWLRENWPAIFRAVLEWTTTALTTLTANMITIFKSIPWGEIWVGLKASVKAQIDNIVNVFRAIPSLIRGVVDFAGLWKDEAVKGVGAVSGELEKLPPALEETAGKIKPLVIPPRVMGDLEKQLRADFERQGAALQMSWEEFRKAKLEEFAQKGLVPAEAAKQAQKAGEKLGTTFGTAFKDKGGKAVEKFDVALSGSAEAISRIQAMQDRMRFGEEGKAAGGLEAALTGGAEGAGRETADTDILRQIRDSLVKTEKKPTVEVQQAGLA